MNKIDKKDYYESLTGIRGLAAIGIVMYHICMLNNFERQWFCYFIKDFDAFVRLFFSLSSFSMMCGYFKYYMSKQFSLNNFYFRRFSKIAPVFYISLLMNLIIKRFKVSIYDIIGTASLLFAFFPSHQISTVDAAWALGIEIIFYLVFPTFLVAVQDRKRTWIAFFISLVILISYDNYYGVNIQYWYINILKQSIWFVLGALIYHYRTNIGDVYRNSKFISISCTFIMIIVGIILYHFNKDVGMLFCFSAWISYAVALKDPILNSKIVQFFGGISFEIYLFHIPIYRCIKKVFSMLPLNIIECNELYYIALCITTILLTSLTATILKIGIRKIAPLFQ